MAIGILGALAMLALLHVLLVLLARQFAALGARFWATARAVIAVVAALVAAGMLVAWLPAVPGFVVGLALAGIPGGGAMAAMALRRRRRLPRREGAVARGAHGLDGMVALLSVVVGIFLHRAGWLWFGGAVVVVSSAAALRLMWNEIRLGDRMLEKVREGLEGAEHWPAPASGHEQGFDPWEDDRLRGRWRGVPVRVAMLHDGARIEADLQRWPSELSLAEVGEGTALGDRAFDRRWSIQGSNLEARIALNHEARETMLKLAERCSELSLDAGQLVLRLDGEHLASMPDLLDGIAKLARVHGEVPAARLEQLDLLLETVEHERLPDVRRGHYRVLLNDEHQRRRVLLAAAEDPDDEIRALAEQETAELSAYR